MTSTNESSHLGHVCAGLTVGLVLGLCEKCGSYRKLAAKLGYDSVFATTLSKIARGEAGAISARGERKLRRKMGYPVGREVDHIMAYRIRNREEVIASD